MLMLISRAQGGLWDKSRLRRLAWAWLVSLRPQRVKNSRLWRDRFPRQGRCGLMMVRFFAYIN